MSEESSSPLACFYCKIVESFACLMNGVGEVPCCVDCFRSILCRKEARLRWRSAGEVQKIIDRVFSPARPPPLRGPVLGINEAPRP